MSTSKRISVDEARLILAAHGQENILDGIEELSAGKRAELLKQIASIDWKMIDERKKSETGDTTNIDVPEAVSLEQIEEERARYEERGLFLIRAGKVACVMLAGGMGTRMGLDRPKGEVNIGRTRRLYIFQCLIKNLSDTAKKARKDIPLYIMTNEKFHERTQEFFKNNNYFGYPKEMIHFFPQTNYVCTDFNGKLFFEEPGKLASSPNGNGGWFKSMEDAGIVPELTAKGVEWINVFGVDNVLQRIADPVFIGACALGGHDSGAKAVKKNGIFEKVGVFCKLDGHPAVVEYYDMDDSLKSKKDENGELLYKYGVILNYLFKVDKLKNMSDEGMPIHYAKKKIPYMDKEGNVAIPTEPNGYKYETLAADMVRKMNSCLCFEVARGREFAPIKNESGNDSIESARILLAQNGVLL